MPKPTREMELAFARDPDRWPAWPQLPLKRKQEPSFGRLLNETFSDNTVEPIVYFGTIFEVVVDKNSKKYTDLEAVFDDGWEID